MNNRRRLDIITAADFASDLHNVSLEVLRQRRSSCNGVDTELSYYRRLLHGRMDLLAFEIRRRNGEESRSLIEALPEILANGVTSHPHDPLAKSPEIGTPDFPQIGRRGIDRVLDDDFLARLPTIATAEIEEIQQMLQLTESEVSERRHQVHAACQLIQDELSRRYSEDLPDVSTILDD